jgi:hypothetical protein
VRIHRELIDRFGGQAVGADDPAVLERWTAGRSHEDVVFATIDGLEPVVARQAYAMLVDDSTRIVVACNVAHACLAGFLEWAGDRDDILFVATPTGPPPPAVFILEKAPGAA